MNRKFCASFSGKRLALFPLFNKSRLISLIEADLLHLKNISGNPVVFWCRRSAIYHWLDLNIDSCINPNTWETTEEFMSMWKTKAVKRTHSNALPLKRRGLLVILRISLRKDDQFNIIDGRVNPETMQRWRLRLIDLRLLWYNADQGEAIRCAVHSSLRVLGSISPSIKEFSELIETLPEILSLSCCICFFVNTWSSATFGFVFSLFAFKHCNYRCSFTENGSLLFSNNSQDERPLRRAKFPKVRSNNT